MSSAMEVYLIPLARMRSLLGSGRRDVLAQVIEENGDFLAELDQEFEDQFEDEEPLTMEGAVTHLLDGGPYRDGAEALYLFAFESLCATVGERLDNRAFQVPIRWEYVEAVDQRLGLIEFPLRVAHLAAGGIPFTFPCSDCMPSIGHWPHEKAAAARKRLTKDRLDSGDGQVDEALVTIRGWLDALAKRKGGLLIGIYS